VDEFGEDAPILDIGGRALRGVDAPFSGSPYSMWRDVAITNKDNLGASVAEAGAGGWRTSAKTSIASNWRKNSSAAHQLRKESAHGNASDDC